MRTRRVNESAKFTHPSKPPLALPPAAAQCTACRIERWPPPLLSCPFTAVGLTIVTAADVVSHIYNSAWPSCPAG